MYNNLTESFIIVVEKLLKILFKYLENEENHVGLR